MKELGYDERGKPVMRAKLKALKWGIPSAAFLRSSWEYFSGNQAKPRANLILPQLFKENSEALAVWKLRVVFPLSGLKEKLIKIGAKVVRPCRDVRMGFDA